MFSADVAKLPPTGGPGLFGGLVLACRRYRRTQKNRLRLMLFFPDLGGLEPMCYVLSFRIIFFFPESISDYSDFIFSAHINPLNSDLLDKQTFSLYIFLWQED
jgi:hypothetical protein